MSVNTSAADRKYYLEVDWGTAKKMYIEKFSFGDEFFYAERIDGQKQFVQNPVYIYPQHREMHSNPVVSVLEQFYHNSSLLPRCSIGVELTEGRGVRKLTLYRFHTVKVLERFGGGDRRVQYYKLQFDNWSS